MGLSDETEDSVQERFENLCLDLNMDPAAKEEAWQSYLRIQTNYTLEGDQIHWLACALYEACRKAIVPTVGTGNMEGNCVSLTRLLRSAKFSLIQFFSKMRKWSDMANLPQSFRDKVDRLERNFAVSTVIFKKLEPIFLDIFRSPSNDPPRQQRSRNKRKQPCTVSEVFNFLWTMFVQVKGGFPAISDDLVNSYHLLLSCIDWIFSNALLAGRKDLLNPEFSGLPEGYLSSSWKPGGEAPCLIQLLCDKHEGLVVEAKTIKEHWWKPHVKRLFEKKVLKGRAETLSGILDTGNFEANSKAMNHAYEEYVLSKGDFDERIFLGEAAAEEIGSPRPQGEELSHQMAVKRSTLKKHFEETRSLTPSTPLTGRRYLKDKEQQPITPVSTATQSVSRLQALLSGRKTCPSPALQDIFRECSHNPQEEIVNRVKEMGELFCTNYVQQSDHYAANHIDFARKRLQLGECLYYKLLENVVTAERKRLSAAQNKVDLSSLLDHEMFHKSLFACCLEVVIFSYNSQRTFPWIVEVFDLAPYHFYKVIEIIIRAEEGLSRDVVKHLNHIEETILESLAWKSESPLWEAVKEQGIPSCEEVTPAREVEMSSIGSSSSNGSNGTGVSHSPMVHPRVKSLAVEGSRGGQHPLIQKVRDPLMSPTGIPASERFVSPGSAKRRLFATTTTASSSSASSSPLPAAASVLLKQVKATSSPAAVSGDVATESPSTQTSVLALTNDGKLLISVQIPPSTVAASSSSTSASSSSASASATTTSATSGASATPASSSSSPHDSAGSSTADPKSRVPNGRPKKTGSVALFFRKFYHLASVRLRDLCDRMGTEEEDLRRKMWTCFEHSLTEYPDLMLDRHLDQLLMCAVYVMAKVTDRPLTFQHIMKCYRIQPQAQSHVYRSVLLNGRRRHTSGSSESSKSGSGDSSPVTVEKERDPDRKRTEQLANIRSTSTLPVPHPNSQPPTPTKMIGSGTTFDFGEERGDLIQFYNTVFVKKVRHFALKFSKNVDGETPRLSPLPPLRAQVPSPRRVSTKYSVFISPHKSAGLLAAPGTAPTRGMSYCINRSPAKDLRAINNMIRLGEKKLVPSGKRQLEVDVAEDENEDASPLKRARNVLHGHFMRRLRNVSSERQEANGVAS